ncbi:hypothetical protein PHLCEN_2v4160 [Hermanssonia centrifuga]|uniref:Uncharacterized protein n=1 Tax=Hermanssonia centrifuga TaxID=98765 RepID=A0A2R6PZR3_9APHY|nr:hypothetical protein PHLCEN_2v4160 [Hermanssonia centrifuga]
MFELRVSRCNTSRPSSPAKIKVVKHCLAAIDNYKQAIFTDYTSWLEQFKPDESVFGDPLIKTLRDILPTKGDTWQVKRLEEPSQCIVPTTASGNGCCRCLLFDEENSETIWGYQRVGFAVWPS